MATFNNGGQSLVNGNITANGINRKTFYVDSVAPSDLVDGLQQPFTNQMWIDSTTTPGKLKQYDGSSFNNGVRFLGIRTESIKAGDGTSVLAFTDSTGAVDALARTWSNFVASSPTFSGTVGGTAIVNLAPTVEGAFSILRTGAGHLALELGSTDATGGNVYLDLRVNGAATDYSARIIRNSGANGTFDIVQTGTGPVRVTGADFAVRDGKVLRLYDAGGTKQLAMYHDGTNVIIDATSDAMVVGNTVTTFRPYSDLGVSSGGSGFRWAAIYGNVVATNSIRTNDSVVVLSLTDGTGAVNANSRAWSNFKLGNQMDANGQNIVTINGLYGQSSAEFSIISQRNDSAGVSALAFYTRNGAGSSDTVRAFFKGKVDQGSGLFTLYDPMDFESYADLKVISAPSDPSAGYGRLYAKAIDANNDGIYIKRKIASAVTERRLLDKIEFNAGTLLWHSNDTSRGTGSTTYAKLKESTLYKGGSITVKFDLSSGSGGTTVYAQIYKNGSAVGTERSMSSTTPATYSEDISGLNPGDLIQVYGKTSNGSVSSQVQNFRLYVDIYESAVATGGF